MAAPQIKPLESPDGAKFITRLIWIAMLMGQVSLMFVVLASQESTSQTAIPLANIWNLFIASWVTLVICVGGGLFARNQMYKRHWVDKAVTPVGYFQGNLILLALCEVASLFGWVVVMMHETFGWPVWVPVLAMAVQILNFPNGRAMQDQELHLS